MSELKYVLDRYLEKLQYDIDYLTTINMKQEKEYIKAKITAKLEAYDELKEIYDLYLKED